MEVVLVTVSNWGKNN